MGPLLTVPNLSEGRSYHFYRGMRDVIVRHDVTLHSIGWDVDHNRTVAAFSGEADGLRSCLLDIASFAIERIDLSRHRGVHPRIGALDVVPIIATSPAQEPQALLLASSLGPRLADLGLPVFLYGRSARDGRASEVPALRRGQFEGWIDTELVGEHAPDFGPPRLHPTAGATILGARGPLIAFNVNLSDPDPATARTIAAAIRADRTTNPALAGVQAMGVRLESRGRSQVSTNITNPDCTTMLDVYRLVNKMETSLHTRMGKGIESAEIIGIVRRSDLARIESEPDYAEMKPIYWPEQVLEY